MIIFKRKKENKENGTKPRKVREGIVSQIDQQRGKKETEREKGRKKGTPRHEEKRKRTTGTAYRYTKLLIDQGKRTIEKGNIDPIHYAIIRTPSTPLSH